MYFNEKIGNIVDQLDYKKKLIFIYMLLTRQKNVYDHLAENKIWDCREEISSVFEELLKCILEEREISEHIITKIQKCNPENIGWDEEEDDIMGYMITFVDNVKVFTSQLMDKEQNESLWLRYNYDFLDGFVDEMYDSAQPLMETILMKQELEREMRDYELLKNMGDLNVGKLMVDREMLVDQETIRQFRELGRE